jgi:hypothetical protein
MRDKIRRLGGSVMSKDKNITREDFNNAIRDLRSVREGILSIARGLDRLSLMPEVYNELVHDSEVIKSAIKAIQDFDTKCLDDSLAYSQKMAGGMLSLACNTFSKDLGVTGE